MAKTDIEVGCTVLDMENQAWRVLAINESERFKTDLGFITTQTATVTNGLDTTERLFCLLSRAEMTTVGAVLARGFR